MKAPILITTLTLFTLGLAAPAGAGDRGRGRRGDRPKLTEEQRTERREKFLQKAQEGGYVAQAQQMMAARDALRAAREGGDETAMQAAHQRLMEAVKSGDQAAVEAARDDLKAARGAMREARPERR